MSYNCDYKIAGKAMEKNKCAALEKQLGELLDRQGASKLIVIPRSELDARLALTAWDRIDKFNPTGGDGTLSNDADKSRVTRFIDAFRNKGPEMTME